MTHGTQAQPKVATPNYVPMIKKIILFLTQIKRGYDTKPGKGRVEFLITVYSEGMIPNPAKVEGSRGYRRLYSLLIEWHRWHVQVFLITIHELCGALGTPQHNGSGYEQVPSVWHRIMPLHTAKKVVHSTYRISTLFIKYILKRLSITYELKRV